MGFAYCCDCKKATEVVTDESAGDTICSECGLVLESYSIDETSEWRTFADNSSNIDPVRVGEPTNPLLTQGRFSTVISNSKGSDILWQKKNQEGCNPHDEKLVLVFKNIAIMADRLELVATIKYRANEIYRDARSQKSRHNEDALITACIYLACRQEQLPRKLKEVSSVANGATKNEIVKAAYFCIWCRKAASLSCFPS